MNKRVWRNPGEPWIPPLRRKVRGSGRDDKAVELIRNVFISVLTRTCESNAQDDKCKWQRGT